MRANKLLLLSIFLTGAANAADITLYYSPSCPHCHNAREFIGNELAYEYPTVKIEALNVHVGNNMPLFQEALKKCEFDNGGIPVIVIGEKCFQGYADFMKQELRDATAVGLSDAQKAAADENVRAFAADPEKLRAANPERANAMVERVDEIQKKNEINANLYFFGVLTVLVLGLGFVLLRKKK